MTRAARLSGSVVLAFVLALEIVCRLGLVSQITMIAPSQMVARLFRLLWSGELGGDLLTTLRGVSIAVVCSISVGFVFGAIVHGIPRVRKTLDPLFATYYSVPIFAFYPLFIVLFGLTDIPKVMIAFLLGVVAMIMNTLIGLDRVPRVLLKMARSFHMSRASTLMRVILPSAAPNLFTGVKLAVAYSFIGVVGSEFILATAGLGYQISFAYHNFDTETLYAVILFIIIFSTTINLLLISWEKRLLVRRGIQ